MKKMIATVVAGVFLFAVSSAGYADQVSVSASYKGSSANIHYSQNTDYKKCFQRFYKQLNLTSSQKQKVNALQAKYEPQFNQYMTKLRSDRVALVGYVGKQYDEDKVSDLAEDYGETKAKLIELKMKFFNEVFLMLTPQQQQKMMKLNQKYMSKHYCRHCH